MHGEQASTNSGETDVTAAQKYYGRWARLYDIVARYTPGIGSLRAQLVGAVAPAPGETVVDMGCGTGANLPYLRDSVGATGTVVGVDFTRGVLDQAATLIDRAGWENVHLVRGDATAPPISDPVDAIVATFVMGMLSDPPAAIQDWFELIGPGGRIGLMDAARSDRPYGPLVNGPFRGLVLVSTPARRRRKFPDGPTAVLDRRVANAHETIRESCAGVSERTNAFGIVRTTAGTVTTDVAEEVD